MANENEWCFSWMEPRKQGEATKAALIKGLKWESGDIITVSFLDGSRQLQDRVVEVAESWIGPGMANLELVFQKKYPPTDIRISFNWPGNWSAIGTDCKSRPSSLPTLNLGDLKDDSSDEEIRKYVLHEFGHALGLIHEHQHPENGINWDKEAVFRDLAGPPNNWPREQIEYNMFKAFDKTVTNFSKFDSASIMLYPIPKKWTTDGYSVEPNNDLSEIDKAFIHEQYP